MKTKNQFTYPREITLETLEDLLAHHRAIFGGMKMVDPDPDPDPKPDPDPDPKPTYTPPATQADLDRIIGDRISRERAKYADYDDIKAKAEAHDKALEDAKTESQKAIDAARTEGEQTARDKTHAVLIKAEARTQAALAKFRNPADAVALLDLSKVSVSDDGEVDDAAVKTALEDLVKERPYLVDDGKIQPKPDPTQGGGGGDDKPSMSRGREMFANRKGGTKTT